MTSSMRKDLLYPKNNLIDLVLKYRERNQAFLFCVDIMLSLTKAETQRQPGRFVTELETCFPKLESSWVYWFPDVRQKLMWPNIGANALKQRQLANGTSTDAAMRCPHTRKLKQKRVNETKPNFVKRFG